MMVNLREEESIEVQMAPLIDCVFLLLIFFLVSTTLKKIDKELPLTLPDASAAIEVQQPDKYAIISIDKNGSLYLDGTPMSVSLLQNDLRSKAQTMPDVKLRLDVDRDVAFSRVMEVLDMLQFEGLKNVAINTRQDRYEPKSQ